MSSRVSGNPVSVGPKQHQGESRKANAMTTTTTSDVSELRMNVAALKRVDPYVKEILETATHVALYNFNEESNEWEKNEIEGALFVYSRMGEPYNSFLIMNRLNTKNQMEPVTPGLDLEFEKPFLFYRNAMGCTDGIWFYDSDEYSRISSLFFKISKESDSTNKVALSIKNQVVQKNSNNVDLLSMLNKDKKIYYTKQTDCSNYTFPVFKSKILQKQTDAGKNVGDNLSRKIISPFDLLAEENIENIKQSAIKINKVRIEEEKNVELMYRNYIQKMEKLGKFSNSTLFAKNQLIKRKDKKWNVITPDFIKNEPDLVTVKQSTPKIDNFWESWKKFEDVKLHDKNSNSKQSLNKFNLKRKKTNSLFNNHTKAVIKKMKLDTTKS